MVAINRALGDDEPWLDVKGGVINQAPDGIGNHMDQHISDTGQVLGDMGWCANFHRGAPGGFSTLEVQCGAGAWTGNIVWLKFPDRCHIEPSIARELLVGIQSIYDPEAMSSFSSQAVQRRLDKNPPPPRPIVDWMVYLANTLIPAEELPMVHSVERVGSGTLVILKKEPINLDTPEDLALVEAVEPVIRRHQPDLSLKPPPRRPRTT